MKKSSSLPKTGIVQKILAFLVAVATLVVVFQTSSQTAAADDQTVTHPLDISTCLPDPKAPATEKTIITDATTSFTDANGGQVDPLNVNKDTNVKLHYDWAIPNSVNEACDLQAGDYFTFKLPAGVQARQASGSLGDYGTYSIATDGTVTFVFNNQVESNDTISGDFDFSSTISTTTSTGKQTITIPTTEEPKNTTIVVNPIGGSDITKSGTLTGADGSGKNPTGITWDVIINTDGKNLKNATVADTMPSATDKTDTSTTTVSSSLDKLVVYPLTVNLDGNVTATGDPLVKDTDYTVNADGTIAFIGKYADTYSAFKIEYQTSLDNSQVPQDGGNYPFDNTAYLSSDGQPTAHAEASTTAEYGKFINKSFQGQDNHGGQLYNWEIDYNGQNKSLPAGTTITDTLSEGQVFNQDAESIALVYADSGNATPIKYKVAYSADGVKPAVMTITFLQEVDSAVKITYQSKVTSPIDADTSDATEQISNTATSNGSSTDAHSRNLNQQGLTKTVSAVNYDAKQVTWKYDINMARQEMSNWQLKDTVPEGLTVDYDSFKLVDTDDTSADLKEGTAFTVTKTDTGFTVDFIGPLAGDTKDSVAKDWYTLTYTTTFDTSQLPSAGKWTNTGKSTWYDQDKNEHDNSSQADFAPNTNFQKDGSKSGSYNPVTKRITWTVVVNYNQRKLSGATISDKILGNQTYVEGSAKLSEASISADNNGTASATTDVTSQYKPSYDDNSKTVSVELPDGSTHAYILTFETSLEGTVIGSDSTGEFNDNPVKNDAIYTNDSKSSTLHGEVTVPNAGNFVEKTGSQSTQNGAYVNWNITVNKSQSTLSDVKLLDEPTANQIIDENSIAIYPETTVDGNTFTPHTDQPLVKDVDYSVDLTTGSDGTQKLIIKFLKQINSAYSVQYNSLIQSDEDQPTLGNTVTITGDGSETITDNTSTSTRVQNSGGSSTGKNTNLLIQKTDKDTGKALPGAQFELFSVVNNKPSVQLRAGTTDDNGQLKWQNVKSGKYILVETQAPNGYVIPTDLASGRAIDINYDNAQNDYVEEDVTNQQGKLSIEKTDGDTSKPLAGATFALYQCPSDSACDSNGTLVSDSLKTDENGKATYTGLNAGSYYVVEKSAPAGYELNSQVQKFTINGSNIEQSESFTNAEKTGSVVLTKTDSDTGKVLAGVGFNLYDSSDKIVKEGLTTGSDGKITVNDLKPGNYYFKETSAPAGYSFDKDKQWTFTVDLQTSEKVATVNATNAEITGSVVLTKTDSDTGDPLAGAVFDLYSKAGVLVKSGLSTDSKGQISYDGLKPGDYYFKEVSAPAGYSFDKDKQWTFTVDLQTSEKVATVNATNAEITGSVVLTKTDSDTNKALAGAVFSLYKDGQTDALKTDLTTGSDGTVTVDGLKPGDYYFVEIQAPAGYVLNDSKLNFTVELQTEVKVATASATNAEKTGSVVLTKTDSDTNKPLAKAMFDLYKADGTKLQSGIETPENGTVTVDGLKPGDYYFVETQAPAGYVLNASKLPFTIELQTETKVATVSAPNAEITGSVVLTKTDSATGKALAGAVFSLYKADGTKIKDGLKTGANGKLTVNNLKPGDYYFQETQAPGGYRLNSNKLKFTVVLQTKEIDAAVNAKNVKIPAAEQKSTGESPLAKTGTAIAGIAGVAAILALLGFGSVFARSKYSNRRH
ncbi:MAG: SpaA isopeptide-forming pilin-related protein [Bifidobacterium aquikefiri]|uniref:SpaA isopeptide-forming pilin-related protein n=1 Tax=Bifidobacterium aquikefiri TaxID=1653207 RepID=UPI0039E92AAE